MNPVLEHCCNCDEPTGHSGRFEDSLYDAKAGGPYCDNCWEVLPEDLLPEDYEK